MSTREASSAAVEVDLTTSSNAAAPPRISWKVGNRVMITDSLSVHHNLPAVCISPEDPDGMVTIQLEHSESHSSVRISALSLARYKKCFNCGNLDDPASEIRNQKCAGCQEAFYCSVSCQTAHWPIHKVTCLKEKGFMELDEKMSKTQMSRQSSVQGIPQDLQMLTSKVMLDIPAHVHAQGKESILAYVTKLFSKGKPQPEVFDRIGIYTKAYFSLLNNPTIADGRCEAETDLEALLHDLVKHQQAWDGIFTSDTDVVKASRIAELMAALATIYFQRGDYILAMAVTSKSSEILLHMFDIIEDRMPAQIKPSTMTDADFPSPSGTFIAMDCAGIPDAREARILLQRLTFNNHERCLNCSLLLYRSNPSKFREESIKNGCFSLRRLMYWELDYQANPSLMKYGIFLCSGAGKKFKKTAMKKKLSTMTDAQIQSIFMLLADDVERA